MSRHFKWMPAAAASLVAAVPALAHHSFAMFDMRQTLTLQGTVKEFQWTNPHCFVQLLVPTPDSMQEWSVELHSPGDMYRHGWRPGTFKPGDKVTLMVHPDRDGTKGGLFVSAIAANGQLMQMPGGAGGPKP